VHQADRPGALALARAFVLRQLRGVLLQRIGERRRVCCAGRAKARHVHEP